MTKRVSTVLFLGLVTGSLLLLAACGGGSATVPAETVTATVVVDRVPPHGQLPKDVRPLYYNIALEVLPDTDTYSGHVSIRVQFDSPHAGLWLHGRDFKVSNLTVTPAGQQPMAATWELSSEEGVVRINTAGTIPAGEAVVSLDFVRPFSGSLEGLYKVKAGGENYAFTQFEAISARLAYPGFDEPAFKTPFDVTLTVAKEDKAAANTHVISDEPVGEDKHAVRFATTEKLPTYLIAWAVGPLDIVEAPAIPANAVRAQPLPFRGIATKGQGAKLAYALANTPKILATLEDYFGIAYPYDKLDIVAVPDFGSGAMENAGLITFREPLLLIDEKTAPENRKRGFAYVMAHELAHQWFGDLVTMKWWDDIWLNEAFATWMGNKVIRVTNPEHHAELTLLEGAQGAMRLDSYAAARQIRQPIKSDHDIENAFDGITYQKGGGVLEMVERWISPETFQKGIRAYLNAHRWGNTSYEDLLSALTTAAGLDVATPFKSFLFQPGVPLLGVAVSCEGDKASLTVTQSRYLPAGSTGTKEHQWQVPLCARYGLADGTVGQTCGLVDQATDVFPLDAKSCPAWVMPNADGAGYFRFAMASEDLAKLRDKGFAKLTTREKMALGDSMDAAFRSGDVDVKDALATMPLFAKDPARTVAQQPMDVLAWLRNNGAGDGERLAVQTFAKKLYGPVFAKLGWKPKAKEEGEIGLWRATLASFLVNTAKDPAARKEAARLGRAYVGTKALNREAVDGNLAGVAVAAAVEAGDAAFFDLVLARGLEATDPATRANLIGALGYAKDPALAQKALGLILDERIRKNEMVTLMAPQLAALETRPDAWKWFQTNWDGYVTRLTKDGAGSLANYARYFCSEEGAKEAESFFGPRVEELLGGPRNLAINLESVRLCASLKHVQENSIYAAFGRGPAKLPDTKAAKQKASDAGVPAGTATPVPTPAAK